MHCTKILAIEFSSSVRSVAVLDLDSAGAVPVILGCASEEGGRSIRPLPLVDLALDRARLEREAVECLAIGLGPGSYTGIRSAIALAQGWQLARPVNLIGISSAEGLAAAAHAQGWFGGVGIVIDAQRGEFYFAGYEIGESGWQVKEPLRIAAKAEAPALASAYSTIAGPEATAFFPTGRILCPDAKSIGGLARGRSDFTPGESLEPIYLRETQFVKAPPPRSVPGL
jgi:tRNA threonylcarbamoyl adenosine modification protein YeaZ